MPFSTRLWLAFLAWYRVLADGEFATRVSELESGPPELPPAPPPAPATPSAPAKAAPSAVDGALQLLALLQREGRLVDFVQQDIASFSDAQVGAAARVVHEGCRKALRAHGSVANVRNESEGAKVTVEAAQAAEVKLTGNVTGAAPYHGTLRHRGWRVSDFKLPTLVGERDLSVLAPAEVEL